MKTHFGRLLREDTVLGPDSFIQQFKSKLFIHMLNSVLKKKKYPFFIADIIYIACVWMVASAVRVLYAHEMESVLFPLYSHTKLILCHFANILWTNEHMMCTCNATRLNVDCLRIAVFICQMSMRFCIKILINQCLVYHDKLEMNNYYTITIINFKKKFPLFFHNHKF